MPLMNSGVMALSNSNRLSAMESPCVKICVIDPATKRCTGCLRTLEEIARWTSMTISERRRIMNELPHRKPAATVQK